MISLLMREWKKINNFFFCFFDQNHHRFITTSDYIYIWTRDDGIFYRVKSFKGAEFLLWKQNILGKKSVIKEATWKWQNKMKLRQQQQQPNEIDDIFFSLPLSLSFQLLFGYLFFFFHQTTSTTTTTKNKLKFSLERII